MAAGTGSLLYLLYMSIVYCRAKQLRKYSTAPFGFHISECLFY